MKYRLNITPKSIFGLFTIIIISGISPVFADEAQNKIKPLMIPTGTVVDLQGIQEQNFSGELQGVGGENPDVSDDTNISDPYHMNNTNSSPLNIKNRNLSQEEQQSLGVTFAEF